jgi:predicted ATPase
MIESVSIQGFKCLRDVTVGLHPLTVLIGKNDGCVSRLARERSALSRQPSARTFAMSAASIRLTRAVSAQPSALR